MPATVMDAHGSLSYHHHLAVSSGDMSFVRQSIPGSSPPPSYSQLKRSQPEPEIHYVFDRETAPPLPRINNPDIVLQAFTHPSVRPPSLEADPSRWPDNERLCSLGRVVLDAVITEILFNARPCLRVPQMMEKRKQLMSEDMLQEWVNHYGLLNKLRCDPKVRNAQINMPKEYRDIFHAYVAAVYLDSGADSVRQWVEQLLGQNVTLAPRTPGHVSPMVVDDRSPPPSSQEARTPPMKKVKAEPETPAIFFASAPPPSKQLALPEAQPVMQAPPMNARSNPLAPARPSLPFLPLFNQMAAQRRVTVTYEAQFSGPSHAGTWIVRCIVNNIPKGEGTGSSKQNAKEEAARQAYYAMGWT